MMDKKILHYLEELCICYNQQLGPICSYHFLKMKKIAERLADE